MGWVCWCWMFKCWLYFNRVGMIEVISENCILLLIGEVIELLCFVIFGLFVFLKKIWVVLNLLFNGVMFELLFCLSFVVYVVGIVGSEF